MGTLRNALVDLRDAVASPTSDADTLKFLDTGAGGPIVASAFAPAVDDVGLTIGVGAGEFTNVNISAAGGTVGGRTVIEVTEGSVSTPDFDEAGVLFNDAIAGVAGETIFLRLITEQSADFLVGLHDFTDFGLTLSHKDGANTALKSTVLRFKSGGISVVRGGAAGTEEQIAGAPSYRISDSSIANLQFPIFLGITFTTSGYIFRIHIPGVTAGPIVIHTEDRGVAHPSGGWVLHLNKFSDQNPVGLYDVSVSGSPFKSGIILTGPRILAADTTDLVQLSSLQIPAFESQIIGIDGLIRVRFPDHDAVQFFTLAEVAELAATITGKQQYAVDFKLDGDAVLSHPVRIQIDDQTLVAPQVTGT